MTSKIPASPSRASRWQTPAESSLPGIEAVTLGAADGPAMIELTELTKLESVHCVNPRVGTFFGIRIEGRLVAMAWASG